MSQATPLFVIHLLGFIGFLWHGLYVLTRGERHGVSRLTGVTAIVTSLLFLTGGIQEALQHSPPIQQVALLRLFWTFSVVPAALWLHVSMRLTQRAGEARWRRPAIVSGYAAAAVIAVLGSCTDLIRVYHTRGGALFAAGPLYVLYVLFVVTCAGAAVANFTRLRAPGGAPRERQVPGAGEAGTYANEERLLILGAVCFLVGVAYFTLLQLSGTTNSPGLEAPAWALLLIGLGAVGGTVGVQSTLLLGRDLRRDFLYNWTGLLILVLPLLAVIAALMGLDGERPRLLALILGGLVTGGHTLYDVERLWLDKAFFTPVVQEERAAARAYVDALATPPSGPNPELSSRKAFDDAVRRALTHLSDPTKLATSPLVNLRTVAQNVRDTHQEDNRLNRAAVLKETLLDLLDALRPADRAGGVTGDASRFYNCLYYPYVQGINRRRAPGIVRQLQERRRRDGSPRSDLERIAEWLAQVDEDTFYKWQRRGSDTIAAALRDREAAAGGSVPVESAAALASGRAGQVDPRSLQPESAF